MTKKDTHYDKNGNCLKHKSQDDINYRDGWLRNYFELKSAEVELQAALKLLRDFDLWFFENYRGDYFKLRDFVETWIKENLPEADPEYRGKND